MISRNCLAFACLMSLLTSMAALPAMATSICPAAGSHVAKTIVFPADDAAVRDGLNGSLSLGLSPPEYPFDEIAKTVKPCRRLTFVAGSETYTLYGTDEDGPPRYAVGTDPSRVAYVAMLPFPKPALAALKAHPQAGFIKFQKNDFMYVLAITHGDQRQIYRFYDVLPDDERLAADMCAALVGEDPVIATYFSVYNMSDLSHLGAIAKPVAHSQCRATLS